MSVGLRLVRGFSLMKRCEVAWDTRWTVAADLDMRSWEEDKHAISHWVRVKGASFVEFRERQRRVWAEQTARAARANTVGENSLKFAIDSGRVRGRTKVRFRVRVRVRVRTPSAPRA